MKKALCILLTLVLVCAFGACTTESSTGASTTAAQTAAETTAAATEVEATTAEETTAEPEGYSVAFVTDEFVTVTVFETQDMTGTGSDAEGAVSRESDTGTPTKTDGQVNFLLTFT